MYQNNWKINQKKDDEDDRFLRIRADITQCYDIRTEKMKWDEADYSMIYKKNEELNPCLLSMIKASNFMQIYALFLLLKSFFFFH